MEIMYISNTSMQRDDIMSEHIKIAGIWDRIEQTIYDSEMTKVEVAKKCGFERRTLNGKSDNRMLSLGAFAKLCATMNVSADYILGLSEHKRIKHVEE